jgi:uncharacterized protein (DUF1684 family)
MSMQKIPFSRLVLGGLVTLLVSGCEAPPPLPQLSSPEEHRSRIEGWQGEREAGLREPDSWLTVVNLHWLMPGETTLGSDPGMGLVLPGEDTPPWLGTLTLRGEGSFDWTYSPEVAASLPTDEAADLRFRIDAQSRPPVFRWGSLTWFVIERFGEFAIRLRDSESEGLRDFDGLENFPIETTWRIAARFEPYDPPREISTPNVLDIPSTSLSPGSAVFEVNGEEFSLDFTGDLDSGYLFAVFGDETNGAETYNGGRFLSVEAPNEDGWIILDFNTAFNPPCVFTPYATCPVPPPGNVLDTRIEAGEMMYFGLGHEHAGETATH